MSFEDDEYWAQEYAGEGVFFPVFHQSDDEGNGDEQTAAPAEPWSAEAARPRRWSWESLIGRWFKDTSMSWRGLPGLDDRLLQ